MGLTGRPQHDPLRLQQRRVHGRACPAGGVAGDRGPLSLLAPAQQRRLHVHGRDGGGGPPAGSIRRRRRSWFDYNNDGWLDLFIANESKDPAGDPNPCELFRNNGDGTFTECAAEHGVNLVGFFKGVVSADYNNDGRPDLFLSRLDGEKILLRNDGPAGADTSARAPVEVHGRRGRGGRDRAPEHVHLLVLRLQQRRMARHLRQRLRDPGRGRHRGRLPRAAVFGAAGEALPQQRRRDVHRRLARNAASTRCC